MRLILPLVLAFGYSVSALAQTGPGGVGRTDGSSSLVLWLDANQIGAADGATVTSWQDRSGYGNHFTQGNGAQYVTNGANGYPVLRFNGSSNYFERPFSASLTPANFTVMAAVEVDNANHHKTIISNRDDPGGNETRGFILYSGPSSGSSNRWEFWTGHATIPWQVLQSGVSTVGEWASVTGTYRPGTDGKVLYINNEERARGNHEMLANTSQPIRVGAGYNEGLPNYHFRGEMGEIMVYNTVLNSAQRIIVENYLAAKYGYDLDEDDLYARDDGSREYDHDVAGIGRVNSINQHTDSRGTGIVRMRNPTHLGDDEFLFWGHDNADLNLSISGGLPSGVVSRLERVWRVSEVGNVGSIDVEFDLSAIADFASMSNCDVAVGLRLLVDTNNNNDFGDQSPIGGATNIGGNIYRFANVSAIGNNMRFTLAMAGVANKGPGGVGTTDGTSALKLWFRADEGVEVTGNAVDRWINAAGIADLDLAETGGQRPTRVAGAVNGFDEISFDGTNRLRTGQTLTTSNFVTDQASTFVVARADNTVQNSSVYMTDPLQTNRFSNHIPWGGTVYYDIGNCCGNETRLDVGGLSGLTGYSVWSYDASMAGGKQLYRNGSLLQSRSGVSAYSSHGSHRFNIGGAIPGSAGFQGDVAEVIIFNARINAAQRIIIQNYLAAKYGLPLLAQDHYKQDDSGQGDFDQDVAGIGRVDASNLHSDARGTGRVRVLNPSSLDNNDWFFWGHNGVPIDAFDESDVPTGVPRRLARVWRISEVNDVGTIDLYFDMSGMPAATASDLRLLVDDDGVFATGTTQQYTATALACDEYAFLGLPGGSMDGLYFTLGTVNSTQTPLPIELYSFTGKMIGDEAALEWITLTETNNHFFTVQRSHDGKSFFDLGTLEGSGTTREETKYDYTDDFVPYGVLYYRLKQTDYDGAYSYSDVIRLDHLAKGSQLIAIPNPVASNTSLRLRIKHSERIDPARIRLKVVNVMGQEVHTTVVPDSEGDLIITFRDHPSGMIMITAISSELPRPLTARVVVQ